MIVTIGEKFRRRVLIAYGILAVTVVSALAASWILPESALNALTVVALVPIVGAALLLNIRCPKCKAFLGGAVAARILAISTGNESNACPSCGQSLEVPIEKIRK